MSLSWKAGFAKKKPERREEKRDCKTGVIIRSWAAVIRHVNISHVESTYSVFLFPGNSSECLFQCIFITWKKKEQTRLPPSDGCFPIPRVHSWYIGEGWNAMIFGWKLRKPTRILAAFDHPLLLTLATEWLMDSCIRTYEPFLMHFTSKFDVKISFTEYIVVLAWIKWSLSVWFQFNEIKQIKVNRYCYPITNNNPINQSDWSQPMLLLCSCVE